MTRPRSATTSGCSTPRTRLPDWEKVLFAVAHLQRIVPEVVLVGGIATALQGYWEQRGYNQDGSLSGSMFGD